MTELTFMTTKGDILKLNCNLNEKLKNVLKRYAQKKNENYKKLIFFSEGIRIEKKITVQDFLKKNTKKKEPIILVKIMKIEIQSDDSEEENEKHLEKIKSKILDSIKGPGKGPSFEEMQEMVVEYGYDIEKKIEKEISDNPENFIDIKEAVNQNDQQLVALGKLGESLENMGIKVAIDKRNIKTDDYIINNQFISSGIIKKNKYEIHVEENDEKKQNLILNDENEQKKFKEEWKEKISNYSNIPKNEIFITNLRKGSVTMDVIFKKTEFKNKNGSDINIAEIMKQFANTNPKILNIIKKNILGACKLSLDMLDSRGNQLANGWARPGERRGGREYFPPDNKWIGFGLRVMDIYDNGNNEWIGMNGNPNEWAVAYHGTSESAVKPILSKDGKFFSSYNEGATGQKCKDYKNVNMLSQAQYPLCGEGTYCSPHLDYASEFSRGVIIMCRVNPSLIRIPEGEFEENEWITDGTRNTIRPYRLLYKIN